MSTSSSERGEPAAAVRAWLERMTGPERERLARAHAQATAAAGAMVLRPDGSEVPIPPLLTPEAMSTARHDEMARGSHALVGGLHALTAWLLAPERTRERDRLFRAFSPLEAEGLANTRHARHLATARVDFFLDEDDRPRALEVNATIPAMQGYSDIVAEAFLRTVGAARGLDAPAIERLLDDNGRNTDDLLASLVAHHRRLVAADAHGDAHAGTPDHTGGHPHAGAPLRIAIVHRDGDAQLGELRHYARRFAALGHRAWLATPDRCRLDGDGRLEVAGEVPDLVYRHVFARRLDPASDFARACLRPEVHRILNPLASHLEVKGMLGYLSAAASDEGDALAAALGLSPEARRAIARVLPWTRVLGAGPAILPGGERVADLVAAVAGEPARFVVKRSWDYGGKSVFLGAHHDEAAAARAAEALLRPAPLSWPELVSAAASDERDAWVVQGFVRTRPRRHLVAADVAGDGAAVWRDLYVDLSIYTNSGVDAPPRGGASRAAVSRIVNILGGGGLAPLVRDEVLARLMAAR